MLHRHRLIGHPARPALAQFHQLAWLRFHRQGLLAAFPPPVPATRPRELESVIGSMPGAPVHQSPEGLQTDRILFLCDGSSTAVSWRMTTSKTTMTSMKTIQSSTTSPSPGCLATRCLFRFFSRLPSSFPLCQLSRRVNAFLPLLFVPSAASFHLQRGRLEQMRCQDIKLRALCPRRFILGFYPGLYPTLPAANGNKKNPKRWGEE